MPEVTLEIDLPQEAATLALGRALGEALAPGAVVLIQGELGAGKTVLARGMAQGLGVSDDYIIVSPTFTLLNIYPGRVEFFHADLYRLSPEQADDLDLLEEAVAGVLAVEWPELAGDVWPQGCLHLEMIIEGDDARRVRLSGPADIVERVSRQ